MIKPAFSYCEYPKYVTVKRILRKGIVNNEETLEQKSDVRTKTYDLLLSVMPPWLAVLQTPSLYPWKKQKIPSNKLDIAGHR